MNEEIDFIIDAAKEQMQHAIEHLVKELRSIRAGKATPSMLSTIMVDYYGSQTPLSQVANVNTPDARTISVQPWEKNMLQEIEKAIMIANIGFNPMNNGESIMINVPPLTEERRKDLVKQAKAEAEHAKVGVRNARKEANNDLKKLDISEDLKKKYRERHPSINRFLCATGRSKVSPQGKRDHDGVKTITKTEATPPHPHKKRPIITIRYDYLFEPTFTISNLYLNHDKNCLNGFLAQGIAYYFKEQVSNSYSNCWTHSFSSQSNATHEVLLHRSQLASRESRSQC